LKISFANEIGALCDRLQVPAQEVMQTLCQDEKLNLSPAYLRPGFAFGGSCLPKDLRALNYRASRLDLDLPLLASVLPSNHQQLARALERVSDLSGRIAVVGLAFKENTDDLRESPVVAYRSADRQGPRSVRVGSAHTIGRHLRQQSQLYFEFDSTHWPPAGCEFDVVAEFESGSPGADTEAIHRSSARIGAVRPPGCGFVGLDGTPQGFPGPAV
jgi:UDP-N-acetyl-D-mannosaminuronate dehydrogenase